MRGTQFVPIANRYNGLMCRRIDQEPVRPHNFEQVWAVINPGTADELAFTHQAGARGTGLNRFHFSNGSWKNDEHWRHFGDMGLTILLPTPLGHPLFATKFARCEGALGNCERFSEMFFLNAEGEKVGPENPDRDSACMVVTSEGPGILSAGKTGAWVNLWTRSGQQTVSLPRADFSGHLECSATAAFLDGTIPGTHPVEVVTGQSSIPYVPFRFRIDGLDATPPRISVATVNAEPDLHARDILPPSKAGMTCRITDRIVDGAIGWAIQRCEITDGEWTLESRLLATVENPNPVLVIDAPEATYAGDAISR